MKRWLACVLPVLLLSGCASDEAPPKRPSYIIPDDSLAAVLAEIHQMGAVYQHRVVRKGRMQPYASRDLQLVLDSFGVSRDRIDSSLNYYKRNPEMLEKIYDESLNILSTRLAEMKANDKNDSLVLKAGSADSTIKRMMNEDGKVVLNKQIPLELENRKKGASDSSGKTVQP